MKKEPGSTSTRALISSTSRKDASICTLLMPRYFFLGIALFFRLACLHDLYCNCLSWLYVQCQERAYCSWACPRIQGSRKVSFWFCLAYFNHQVFLFCFLFQFPSKKCVFTAKHGIMALGTGDAAALKYRGLPRYVFVNVPDVFVFLRMVVGHSASKNVQRCALKCLCVYFFSRSVPCPLLHYGSFDFQTSVLCWKVFCPPGLCISRTSLRHGGCTPMRCPCPGSLGYHCAVRRDTVESCIEMYAVVSPSMIGALIREETHVFFWWRNIRSLCRRLS